MHKDKTELPKFLPYGWKKITAMILGIHPNTVTNALKKGNGTNYKRIKEIVIERWGKTS